MQAAYFELEMEKRDSTRNAEIELQQFMGSQMKILITTRR